MGIFIAICTGVGLMMVFDLLSKFLRGNSLSNMEWLIVAVITSSILATKVHAQDNDDLAFEFINTGAEVMSVAYECKDKLTAKEWSIVQDKSMANVILDPRDYCESLKEELKKLK